MNRYKILEISHKNLNFYLLFKKQTLSKHQAHILPSGDSGTELLFPW